MSVLKKKKKSNTRCGLQFDRNIGKSTANNRIVWERTTIEFKSNPEETGEREEKPWIIKRMFPALKPKRYSIITVGISMRLRGFFFYYVSVVFISRTIVHF